MDLQNILDKAGGIMAGITNAIGDGGGKKKSDPIDEEMKLSMGRKFSFDNKNVKDVISSVGKKTGVNPSLLFTSGFQEGMNKAIFKPDEVSEAYVSAKVSGDYPVDGFYAYGLDTFGDRYAELKKYLPEGFESRFKTYDAYNDKKDKYGNPTPEKIKTAAFKTNEDALMAKAAFLRSIQDKVGEMSKTKGIDLDDQAKNYFTLAAYNAGEGNADIMMDEYLKAKDKKAFIEKGLTSRGGVHKNIYPRMTRMKLADELLAETELPLKSPSQVIK